MASFSRKSPWNHRLSREKSNMKSSISSSSFQTTTVEKLRKLTEYNEYGGNQLALEAKDLTDMKCIMDIHFSEIAYEPVSVRIDEKMEESKTKFLTSEESEASEKRSKWRVEDTAKLNVKLLLRNIDNTGMSVFAHKAASLLGMAYGPLHTSLLINNQVLLEWNTSSLVIPEKYDGTNRHYPIVATVLHRENSITVPKYNPNDEIDLIFQATKNKIDILNALIRVISEYNGRFYYHPIYRNCQTFIVDALKGMGCENPPKFEGNLAAYFKELKAGRSQADYRTHAELDEYVKTNVTRRAKDTPELPCHEMEYLLGQYFQCHIRDIAGCENPEEWQCTQENCQMKNLERLIDEQAMLLHQFVRTENN